MNRSLSIITSFGLSLLISTQVLAQDKKPSVPTKFPPNPLEMKVKDPLVRQNLDKQPLTPTEQQELELALDKLNQDANAKFQTGDKQGAFDTWNREIRLRRYLGKLAEITALERVGEIAWRDNRKEQVQFITQRLQNIHKPRKSPAVTDLEVLQALGQAYQKVRAPKQAIEVYEQVLVGVRQQQQNSAEIETLKTIGSIHMSWFDYTKAAATYEQLLNLASKNGQKLDEITYLRQLVYIYEQAKQPQQSLNARNKLIGLYAQDNNLVEIPALKIAIASNYEVLAKENPKLLDEAFKNYQEAYATAWEQQQYVRAGEALQKLISLYRTQGQIDEALQASQILLQSEELAGNFYGLMKAYDQIGQMHMQRKDYSQARVAFQQGLKIAQELQHDEGYFNEQIQKLP